MRTVRIVSNGLTIHGGTDIVDAETGESLGLKIRRITWRAEVGELTTAVVEFIPDEFDAAAQETAIEAYRSVVERGPAKAVPRRRARAVRPIRAPSHPLADFVCLGLAVPLLLLSWALTRAGKAIQ